MTSEYKPSAGEHPITPPPELVQQCWDELRDQTQDLDAAKAWGKAITLAYQAGADQELEACCEWLGDAPVVYNDNDDLHPGSYLRDARRPKPPTLKEQALEALEHILHNSSAPYWLHSSTELGAETIRRALEALDG
jgi:hypothetical protein